MTVPSCWVVIHDVFVCVTKRWQYRHVELSFSIYFCMYLTDDSTVMPSCLSRCIWVCNKQMTVPSCRVVFHDVYLYVTKRWQFPHVEFSLTMYMCMYLTDDSTVMSSCLSRCISVCNKQLTVPSCRVVCVCN